MPRVPRRPRDQEMTLVGRLMWDAMRAKSAEQGETYGYTDMCRDIEQRTGHRRTPAHIRNIVTGERVMPSQDVLLDIAAALRGYVTDEQLLLAAGYAPREVQEIASRLISPKSAPRSEADLVRELDEIERLFDMLRARIMRAFGRKGRVDDDNVNDSPDADTDAETS